jgi:hypothetical protein
VQDKCRLSGSAKRKVRNGGIPNDGFAIAGFRRASVAIHLNPVREKTHGTAVSRKGDGIGAGGIKPDHA